jgi:ribosomal protein L19, bacterial type
MDAIKEMTKGMIREEAHDINVGDTVKVHVRIKEGERSRIQVFEGTVIAKKHGGISETFTVRRTSYGVGVERVFPTNSPNVEKVETVRYGKVRRAKLYYLRDRVGKSAKVKERIVSEEALKAKKQRMLEAKEAKEAAEEVAKKAAEKKASGKKSTKKASKDAVDEIKEDDITAAEDEVVEEVMEVAEESEVVEEAAEEVVEEATEEAAEAETEDKEEDAAEETE